jgi:predicted ATPase/DNA-binding CsgD family transcriptional regulator
MPQPWDAPVAFDAPQPADLPSQPIQLIGREQDVAAIAGRLRRDDVRLLTVSGPGGVGKTSVALAAAQETVECFADGTVFVDLAPLRDPGAVLPAIARQLAPSVGVGPSSARRLRDAVGAREMLVVLDNVEHVIGAAPDVSTLLAGCPSLKVLATSREPLGVRWEHECPLAPLPLPSNGAQAPEALAEVPSIALFVQRAQAIRPDFMLTANNAATIVAICRRLDGLPLAIEMAAARIRTVSPSLLLLHLEQRTDLLGARVPDAPPRHQTMGAVIGWSYDLLAAEEQSLLRRLSVFEEGCNREAAAVLTDGDPCRLAPLVEKSLAVAVDGRAGEPRISLLETVRSFALEKLRELGEEPDAQRVHAEHVEQFVEEIARRVRAQQTPDYWSARLAAEERNVEAALRWLLARNETDRAGRLQEAVAAVASLPTHQARQPSPSGLPERLLTAREREVAGLIAQGLTSRKIADFLHISEKTVDCHADHIRTKLDLGSRVEIAAWAVAHGLHTPSA